MCQCRRRRFSPWSRKSPHAMEQLSPQATTPEPVLQRPRSRCILELCAAREAASARNLCAAARKQPPPPLEKAQVQQWRFSTAKKVHVLTVRQHKFGPPSEKTTGRRGVEDAPSHASTALACPWHLCSFQAEGYLGGRRGPRGWSAVILGFVDLSGRHPSPQGLEISFAGA